jgi:hypothetical protein
VSLDETRLARIVRRRVAAGAGVGFYDRIHRTPMTETLAVVEELLGGPLAVFWVDGGLPGMFSLPALDPPVVVFGSRHLEIVGTLHGMLRDSTTYADTYMEGMASRFSLRVIAELMLQHGDVPAACHLMIEAVLDDGLVRLPMTIDDLEMSAIDERYMAVWFYGLLHECGHVFVARDADSDSASAEQYVEGLRDAVLAELYEDEAFRDRVRATADSPFVAEVRAAAGPDGSAISRILAAAPTRHDVEVWIRRALGAEGRSVSVVFEGSEAFDRLRPTELRIVRPSAPG